MMKQLLFLSVFFSPVVDASESPADKAARKLKIKDFLVAVNKGSFPSDQSKQLFKEREGVVNTLYESGERYWVKKGQHNRYWIPTKEGVALLTMLGLGKVKKDCKDRVIITGHSDYQDMFYAYASKVRMFAPWMDKKYFQDPAEGLKQKNTDKKWITVINDEGVVTRSFADKTEQLVAGCHPTALKERMNKKKIESITTAVALQAQRWHEELKEKNWFIDDGKVKYYDEKGTRQLSLKVKAVGEVIAGQPLPRNLTWRGRYQLNVERRKKNKDEQRQRELLAIEYLRIFAEKMELKKLRNFEEHKFKFSGLGSNQQPLAPRHNVGYKVMECSPCEAQGLPYCDERNACEWSSYEEQFIQKIEEAKIGSYSPSLGAPRDGDEIEVQSSGSEADETDRLLKS